MKRKIMTLASLACAGTLALSWNDLRAQADPGSPATPASSTPANPGAVSPAPGIASAPGLPPGAPSRMQRPRPMIYQRALMALQQTKAELQRSTNDFEGHRETALDACDKAMTELQAVMKAGGIQPMQRPPMMPPPHPAPGPTPQSPGSPPPAAPSPPSQ